MGLQMFLKLMTVAADVTVGAEWFQMQAAATPKARDRGQCTVWSLAQSAADWTTSGSLSRVCVSGPLIGYGTWLRHYVCLQCFDAVGWAAGRASGL